MSLMLFTLQAVLQFLLTHTQVNVLITSANMLNMAFVDSAFRALGPARVVITTPILTYITIIDRPYVRESLMPFDLSFERLRKKLTVMGIIGHTQGVKRAMNPPRKLVIKIIQSELSFVSVEVLLIALTGFHKSFINLLNGTFQAFEEGKYQGIGNTLNVLTSILNRYNNNGTYEVAKTYPENIVQNKLAIEETYKVAERLCQGDSRRRTTHQRLYQPHTPYRVTPHCRRESLPTGQ